MSGLRQLQEDFHAYLLGDDEHGTLREQVLGDARAGTDRRLKIYHDAYRLRMVEALSQAYPNVNKLMGEQAFDRLARTYLQCRPSEVRNLRWYGADFSAHLENHLPEHPVVAELAQFEWKLSLAFDSADVQALGSEDLAQLPPEAWNDLEFVLHPSVQILDLRLNTPLVWKALEADETPPGFEWVPGGWLIWRKGLDPHFRSLEPDERASLALIRKGACFGELCEALVQERDETAAINLAARYLSCWLADGLLSKPC